MPEPVVNRDLLASLFTEPTQQGLLRRLRTVLGVDVGVDAGELKLLSAAVAEAAADEATRNLEFRSRVRRIYDEFAALPAPSSPSPSSPRSRIPAMAVHPAINLVPLPGTEGIRVDPFAPLDPYVLLRLYGPQQMRPALSRYSFTALKEAATTVKARNPSSRPRDARKADALLDYIVEQVAPGNEPWERAAREACAPHGKPTAREATAGSAVSAGGAAAGR